MAATESVNWELELRKKREKRIEIGIESQWEAFRLGEE